MDDVVAVLEEEHEQIGELHYRLLTLHRFIEAGDLHMLDRASAEVDEALLRVRETELMRTIVVASELERRGADHLPGTLDDLVAMADDQTAGTLLALGEELARRADEVERLGSRTQRLADHGADDLENVGALVGTERP